MPNRIKEVPTGEPEAREMAGLTVRIFGEDGRPVRDVYLPDPREAYVEEFNQRNRPLGVYAEIV